jgi:hypothetical protein
LPNPDPRFGRKFFVGTSPYRYLIVSMPPISKEAIAYRGCGEAAIALELADSDKEG